MEKKLDERVIWHGKDEIPTKDSWIIFQWTKEHYELGFTARECAIAECDRWDYAQMIRWCYLSDLLSCEQRLRETQVELCELRKSYNWLSKQMGYAAERYQKSLYNEIKKSDTLQKELAELKEENKTITGKWLKSSYDLKKSVDAGLDACKKLLVASDAICKSQEFFGPIMQADANEDFNTDNIDMDALSEAWEFNEKALAKINGTERK